jgi:hypothetical protein
MGSTGVQHGESPRGQHDDAQVARNPPIGALNLYTVTVAPAARRVAQRVG